MSNPHGRAARFAYSAGALVSFIDHHSVFKQTDQVPKHKPLRIVNGKPFGPDDIDGRILRRWRNEARGVTADAASRMLMRYNLTTTDFEGWCERHGYVAILRDNS